MRLMGCYYDGEERSGAERELDGIGLIGFIKIFAV